MRKLVLLADDNRTSRSILADTLNKGGYEAVEVYEGINAYDAARILKPDLIVLDISDPGLAVWEICRRLKADPATAAIHLVVLTGLLLDEQAQECGIADFLTKPITSCQFLGVVQRHIGAP